MAFEAFLIALDAPLAEELGVAVGEQRASLRAATPAEIAARAADSGVPRIVLVADDAGQLDRAWWRTVQLRLPRAQLLLLCRKCDDETWRRWILLGATGVLRAPFGKLDLEAEFAGEPTVSAMFHRHPRLAAQGKTMFRYRIPSDPQYIPGVVHVVSLLALEFGFEPTDYTMNLPLAVDEAVSNAIIHGNRRDLGKKVEIEGQVDAEMMRIKIRDEGPGFQRDRIQDPMRPENLLASSGRGLFLIESVMDEVHFSQEGRCIEMHKRARGVAKPAS
jgi:serine/threonine-protein kinase RsbW